MKKILALLLLSLSSFASPIGVDCNQFALSLYAKMDRGGNTAFSPYSIYTNLSLLYAGAANDTASEMQSVLHISGELQPFLNALGNHLEGFTSTGKEGYLFSSANALFLHRGTHILQDYLKVAENTFNAKVEAVDFTHPKSALETINGYISENTQNKITNLVTDKDIQDTTRLIVANAVYFQGDWTFPFTKTATESFYPETGTPFKTAMMHQKNSFLYFEDNSLQCIALPFRRNGNEQPNLQCLLLLPKKGELESLEAHLTKETLSSWLSQMETAYVEIHAPKFCFSEKINLSLLLQSLGMKEAFTHQADFSQIDGMKDLYLDRVLHETYFSFHERGVTAAAATTSHMGVTSAPPSTTPIPFIANHPFLFMILDTHSEAILFLGRCFHPQTGECDEN